MTSTPPPISPFDSKVVCLTGGASGIGWATAKNLYSRGASISIADIDQSALDAAAAFFNHGNTVNTDVRVMLSHVDVGDRVQVDEWIRDTIKRFGKITDAVNGAGVIGKHHGLRAVGELEDEEWDNILRVNLTGMMFCLRAEIGAILDEIQKRAGIGGGSIVCVSSIQGQRGFAKHAAYAASKVGHFIPTSDDTFPFVKMFVLGIPGTICLHMPVSMLTCAQHGIQGLAKSAAQEYGEKNIRVNLIAPYVHLILLSAENPTTC